MARGQIGTPEFYIDHFLWLNTVGSLDYNNIVTENAFSSENAGVELVSSLLRLDPSIAAPVPTGDSPGANNAFTIPTGFSSGYYDDMGNDLGTVDTTDLDNWNLDYVAFLNHNFKTAKCFPYLSYEKFDDSSDVVLSPCTEIINYRPANDTADATTGVSPLYDGFSIADITGPPESTDYVEKIKFNFIPEYGEEQLITTLFLGGVSLGHKFTCPASPDLKLTMKYDVGYKRKETINGRKVAHLNWFRERGWSQFGIKKQSWNLDDQIGAVSHRFNWRKSGRRTWSITFSYISDDNMFPTNLNLSTSGMGDAEFLGDSSGTLEDNGINIMDANRNLMGDTSMIDQLLHKTCFGYLPFIFRPDNTYAKADGFCLAMIDMKSFQIKQVAHKTWSVKLKILELL